MTESNEYKCGDEVIYNNSKYFYLGEKDNKVSIADCPFPASAGITIIVHKEEICKIPTELNLANSISYGR